MIKKSAKKEFLSLEIDDFYWLKKLSHKQLDNILKKQFDPVPQFHTKPFKHQKVAFIIGYFMPEFLYFLDLGTGKTKVILDLIRYEVQCGRDPCALVGVPNVANIEGWEEEISIHAPDLVFIPVHGSLTEKRDAFAKDGHVFVINYMSLIHFVSDLIIKPAKNVVEQKETKKLKIQSKLIRPLEKKFNFLCCDESTAIKNKHSLTFQVCRRFSKSCELRFALTGTPFGRDPIDLWAQFFIVDHGATFGPGLGFFREIFMEEVDDYWKESKYILDDPKKKKELHKRMHHRSIYYHEKECTDLPKKAFRIKKVSFPDDTHQYYLKIVEQLKQSKGDFTKVDNCFVRMRQITSGFLTYVDDDRKLEFRFHNNPKLDMLEQIVDEISLDCKVLIVYEFDITGHMIMDLMDKLGLSAIRLWGKGKDNIATIRTFKNDDSVQYLVMNHKSGAFGLNLQVANYVIFVESPVSPIVRRQVVKRIHRSGQKKRRCFYYDIVMKGSVDERILEFLKEGRNLFKELIRGKVDL